MRANQFQYPSQFAKDEMAPQEPSMEAQAHPMVWGGKFALISNSKPSFVSESPAGSLQQELNQKGVQHEPTEGHYGGIERSFILHNPTREQAMELARRHGQEAVIFSDGGQHELIYVNGPNAGKYHPAAAGSMHYYRTRPRDNYTKIPGHGFARFHFDFNKLLEVPKKSLAPQSDEGVAKTMPTVNDLKKGLADAIKRQIEKYQNDLVELRDRELTKGEGELVSGIGNDAGDFSFGNCPLCQRGDACECVELAKAHGVRTSGKGFSHWHPAHGKGPKSNDCKSCGKPSHGTYCENCGTKPEPRDAQADEGLHDPMDYEKGEYLPSLGSEWKKPIDDHLKNKREKEKAHQNQMATAEANRLKGVKAAKGETCAGCGNLSKMCKCGEMSKGENCLLCGEPPTMCECVSKLQKNTKIDPNKKIGSRSGTQMRRDNAKEDRFQRQHGVPEAKIQEAQAQRGAQRVKIGKGEFVIDDAKAGETPAKGQSKAGEPRLKHIGNGPGVLPGDKAPKQEKGDDGSGGEESASMEVSASDKGLGKAGDVRMAKPPTKAMGAKPPTGTMKMGEQPMEKVQVRATRPPPPPAAMGLKPAAPNFAKPTPPPQAPSVHPQAGEKKVIAGAAPGAKPGTVAARMQVGKVGQAPKKGTWGIFGKSEGFGNCALCGNTEHTGDCQ
jgi:hypothetical protein